MGTHLSLHTVMLRSDSGWTGRPGVLPCNRVVTPNLTVFSKDPEWRLSNTALDINVPKGWQPSPQAHTGVNTNLMSFQWSELK